MRQLYEAQKHPKIFPKAMRDWLEQEEYDATYHAYIISPQWGQRRLSALNYYGWKCQACERRKNLHVHHLDYAKLGNEPLSDLRVLCKKCHKDLHNKFANKGKGDLRYFTLSYIRNKQEPPKNKRRKAPIKPRITPYERKKEKLSTVTYCVDDDYLLPL